MQSMNNVTTKLNKPTRGAVDKLSALSPPCVYSQGLVCVFQVGRFDDLHVWI